MIRFLLRAAGFVLLAAAFAALVVDGTRSIAAGSVMQYSLGETAGWLGGARFAGLLGLAAGWPAFAQECLHLVLAIPSWAVGVAAGIALLLAGRAPGPSIGYSSRGD